MKIWQLYEKRLKSFKKSSTKQVLFQYSSTGLIAVVYVKFIKLSGPVGYHICVGIDQIGWKMVKNDVNHLSYGSPNHFCGFLSILIDLWIPGTT